VSPDGVPQHLVEDDVVLAHRGGRQAAFNQPRDEIPDVNLAGDLGQVQMSQSFNDAVPEQPGVLLLGARSDINLAVDPLLDPHRQRRDPAMIGRIAENGPVHVNRRNSMPMRLGEPLGRISLDGVAESRVLPWVRAPTAPSDEIRRLPPPTHACHGRDGSAERCSQVYTEAACRLSLSVRGSGSEAASSRLYLRTSRSEANT
jgi:hypothetical protein